MRGVQALDHVVAADLDVHEMAQLLAERGEELVVGPELRAGRRSRCRSACRCADPAVVQRDFQDLGQVEIAGQDVGLFAECAGLHAAGSAAGARILDRLALPQQLFHHHVGVEDRRLTPALADDLQAAFAGNGRGSCVLSCIFEEGCSSRISSMTSSIRYVSSLTPEEPSGRQAAGVDVAEVGVGAALGRGHSHLGRRRLVVELHPETLEQFSGLLARERAVRQAALVERDTGAGRDGRG